MKWKPLFAVLLRLLMIGVRAGSTMAMPTPDDKTGPIAPQNFGDRDQLRLRLLGGSIGGGWEKHISPQVEISYDAYVERNYPPANPPCVGGICPTSSSTIGDDR